MDVHDVSAEKRRRHRHEMVGQTANPLEYLRLVGNGSPQRFIREQMVRVRIYPTECSAQENELLGNSDIAHTSNHVDFSWRLDKNGSATCCIPFSDLLLLTA
uniref:Uncharacterized protein n=1 Tax=Peronospora matthiolae TaxID=2874970 RepID=A0AAV1UHK6_9STRA